ncbi:hypothetical protein KIH27_03110 [Mycobacterium sp. M1]|uniref:Pilin n=1 Tax=Mycolicibacter acidiphilus TaxID=2835306 RepID=A0ABS5RE58_9MYCO|nr:hypothetical protein [Mycolicibacter acidiphilus]MBS9532573.1 hypothetical protein [Mycolicibacter acidiphilus]
MGNIARIALVAAASGLVALGAAGAAQAEPRYHWCPGEQWSGWMGGNWNGSYCHDNHYLDNVPHTPEYWQGGGTYDPSWPPGPPPYHVPHYIN